MLNDISGMADWGKVCQGLMRMFEGAFAVLTAP
jgi:Phosphotyrosyl phosphate activator (PTPA) protein